MSFGSFLTKTAGLGAIYLSFVDSHRFGKAFKNKTPQAKVAEKFPDMYVRSETMDINSTSLPTFVSGLKRKWYDLCLQDSIFPFWYGVSGYISGVYTGLVHNALTIALGVGAFASKKLGKFCALGLGLMAAKSILYNVFGVGQHKRL